MGKYELNIVFSFDFSVFFCVSRFSVFFTFFFNIGVPYAKQEFRRNAQTLSCLCYKSRRGLRSETFVVATREREIALLSEWREYGI